MVWGVDEFELCLIAENILEKMLLVIVAFQMCQVLLFIAK